MALEVIWSEDALCDLEEIARYIERDSAFTAARVVKKFYDMVGRYGVFPRASTIVPEIGLDNYRQKIVYSWRVIYRIDDDRVVILAILHGRRLFDAIQGRFLSE